MADADKPRLYSCYKCRNRVALHDDIVSKLFQVIIFVPKAFLRSVIRSSLVFFFNDLRGCDDDDGWIRRKMVEHSYFRMR